MVLIKALKDCRIARKKEPLLNLDLLKGETVEITEEQFEAVKTLNNKYFMTI